MSHKLQLAPITDGDKAQLKELALKNGGNNNLTEDYIQHWYFENPSKSYSLWKAELNGSIEGFATSNNFSFVINNKRCRVAMPQNVLTSVKVRGKGVFNKLYFKTEADNVENNRADYFLTFTNKLSTPIFLSKFGYSRGICPPVVLSFFSPLRFLKKNDFERITDLNSVRVLHPYQFNNALEKSTEHMQWRYRKYTFPALHIIAVKKNDVIIGYAFLKAEKKKGIRFLMLMDVFCEKEKDVSLIIDACYSYTAKNYFLFLMMFELPNYKQKSILQLKIKGRFNFLVKGKNPEETMMLSLLKCNFFFGTMDSF